MIVRVVKPLLTALFGFACAGLAAQGLPDGPLRSATARVTSAGKLNGCSVTFTSLVKDSANNRGRSVVVDGSFALFTSRVQAERLGLLLKVTLLNMTDSGGSTQTLPHYAYISAGTRSTAGKRMESQAAETPGFRLFSVGLDAEVAELLLSIAEGGKFAVSYNRSEGGLDTTALVDLTIADTEIVGDRLVRTTSHDAAAAFGACIAELAK